MGRRKKTIEDAMWKFFCRKPYVQVSEEKYDKNGNVVQTKERAEPCEFPTFARFAVEMGITPAELLAMRENAEFERIYQACVEVQKSIALENAIMGRYDASLVKFFLASEEEAGGNTPFAVEIKVL